MDALAFCIVACLVIAAIALFVKIFNKGKSLHPAQAKEYEDHMRNLLSHPAYDDIPGNIHYDDFKNHFRHAYNM